MYFLIYKKTTFTYIGNRIFKMKFIKLYLVAILVLGISMEACEKKGCSDSRATNFNSFVRIDDGSCLYVDHTLFVTGNYYGTKQTYSHYLQDPPIYNSNTTNFTIYKGGLYDTLLCDGYRLAYAPSDSEPKYFSYHVDIESVYDIDFAYLQYFPAIDSVYYSHNRASLAFSSYHHYFGKRQ